MAEAFLNVVLDNLSSLIKEEIGLILGVDEEMQKLKSTLTTLQAVLEDAEDKQIESKPIRDWLQKLNALAYEIDDILDECNTHVSKLKHTRNKLSRYSLQKILYRHKIGRRMKLVTKKLESVAAERAKFHLRDNSVDRPREVAFSRETGSILNHTDQIYGREKEKENIVGILVSDVKENQDMSVLPIIGVAGLGKTTLARLVFNDRRVEDHFDIRIWVCVSDNFELKTLVKAMIEAATGSTKAAGLQQLDVVERRLWELLSQKRYLIVLDDVWNDHQEKWLELKDILSCGSTGASIIVTTRQQKVADIMGTLAAHDIKGLSDENCWMLLRSRAFGPKEEVCTQLEMIGKEIVKKCVGVPLAAKVLGGILRFKRKQKEWLYVRDSELWKLSPEGSLIMPTLRLSYHHLPMELRQCFAYFAAFPKDHEIDKDELIRLWIAHGHISSKENMEVEDVGNEICNELLLRSLLLSTFSDNKIIMHDLVHDLAQSVMENKIPGERSDRNIPIASIIREVNLVDRTIMFPKNFLPDMDVSSILEYTSVRVFYANVDGIKDLSPSICNLKHLRYLNMSSSGIRSLPNSICTLWNLQILNLDHCYKLMALPKKLTSLHNLQHLFLSNCWSLSEMPTKMRKLTGLKTLSMFVVGAKKGTQLEELHGLNLSGELSIQHLERVKDHLDAKKANTSDKKNLRSLKLSWVRNVLSKLEEDDEKVLDALEPHSNLEYLCIEGFCGRNLPCWMTNSTLEKIVKIDIGDWAYCTRLPKLGELTHLKKLRLWNIGVEYIIEEVGSGNGVKIPFPALEHLQLSNLSNLKSLSKEQESSRGAFPNLKTLWISRCSSFILQPHPSLQKLDSLRCSSSTLAFLSEQDVPWRLNVVIEESVTCLPIETLVKYSSKLQSLNIEGAKEISATEGLEALKGVTFLGLYNCDRMTYIPQGMLQHLTALGRVDIFSCKELVELPEEINHLHKLKVIQLSWLPKMACLPQAIQHLEILFMHDLPELESLPDQLPSLHKLEITNCPKIVSIPALPNAKKLSIIQCPQLERRCQRRTGEDWHKIAHIRRLEIPYN
ncbi:disease resistance protein RGA2-like isoform X2 [Salvia hispanica]|nr:disease resistance protein RGA2-like isoform X2 [Salvia hispanica]